MSPTLLGIFLVDRQLLCALSTKQGVQHRFLHHTFLMTSPESLHGLREFLSNRQIAPATTTIPFYNHDTNV